MTMQFDARIPARTFGIDSDKTVLGFSPEKRKERLHRLATLPAIDSDHIFEPRFFKEVQLWWEWHDTAAPLYISGPSGSGKTSGVLEFMARVNQPCVVLTCRPSMDKTDLLGQWGPGSELGSFTWFEGPAAAAWKYGYTLVINEFSLAPAEMWVSANDLFEGAPIVDERRGKVIERHPNTRVVITDNCRALGAATGFIGRKRQDMTSADRFWHVTLDWPNPQAEFKLLWEKARALVPTAGVSLERLVQTAVCFANKTRWLAKTADLRGVEVQPPALSTRVMIRFVELLAKLTADGSPADNVLAMALRLSIAQGLPPERENALLDLAHEEFATYANRRRVKRS